MINHKELLTKYIQHVRECEGVDFIDTINRHISDCEFSEDEVNELVVLSRVN